MEDTDCHMTTTHNDNEDNNMTSLLTNSMACHNTNFDASVQGSQLRLDLMFRWTRCRCNAGSRPDISLQWFEKLCRYHSEPQRHYHTLMHLEEMFLYMDLIVSKKEHDQDTLVMATFFHDAIYNVHAGTNEEDSAELFQQYMKELRQSGSIIAEEFENSVVNMILVTKTHQVSTENGPLLSLFLDLDMAVLGKEAQAYANYAQLIRREYQHVPHNVYCEKRAEILEDFLKQPQIYGTNTMLMALEQRARDNIRREIDSLRRGEIPGTSSKEQ